MTRVAPTVGNPASGGIGGPAVAPGHRSCGGDTARSGGKTRGGLDVAPGHISCGGDTARSGGKVSGRGDGRMSVLSGSPPPATGTGAGAAGLGAGPAATFVASAAPG